MSSDVARPRPVPTSDSRRRLPLLIGLTMAALAFLGVVALGSLGNKGAAPTATTGVLVASRNIQSREVFSQDMVTVAAVPNNMVPQGAVSQFSAIKGETALVSILKGQMITTNLLTASLDAGAAQTAYLPIPQGFVARAIPSAEQTVDVPSLSLTGANLTTVSLHFGDNGDNLFLGVNGVGFTIAGGSLDVAILSPAATTDKRSWTAVSSSLTVIMSVCDAEMIDWLLANARLTYVLLSYHDYASPPKAVDPACPTVTPAGGIGPGQVNQHYGFTHV